MKTNNTLFILLLSVFTMPALAQTVKPEATGRASVSVKNSEGQLISTSFDTISRAFFVSKEVTILSTQPLKGEEKFLCVLKPMNEGGATLYMLNDGNLPDELKKGVEKASAGTHIMFMVTRQKGQEYEAQSNTLTFVLKE